MLVLEFSVKSIVVFMILVAQEELLRHKKKLNLADRLINLSLVATIAVVIFMDI